MTGHEMTGHEMTGHEMTGHEMTGHEDVSEATKKYSTGIGKGSYPIENINRGFMLFDIYGKFCVRHIL